MCEPGGSNYDVAVLTLNADRQGLRVFPMAPADLEGREDQDAMVPGGRLANPFGNYVIKEGIHTTVGYLLRIPSCGGHWICIVPGTMADESRLLQGSAPAALLCDSLASVPCHLTKEHVEQLLQAFAIEAAHTSEADINARYACFLVGRQQ